MKLVIGWQKAYTWFSVQGALVLTALSTVYSYFPAFRSLLPAELFGYITAALGLTIIIGRLIQQGVIEVKVKE